MGLFSGMSISASGLAADRVWMNVVANNIANANTTNTPQGGPYRREEVVLGPISGPGFGSALQAAGSSGQAGGGVQVLGVVQDPSPFRLVYDPGNPAAVNGYVQMPNVSIATEMVDMIAASRAYQANVTAFDAAKAIDVQALNIGK